MLLRYLSLGSSLRMCYLSLLSGLRICNLGLPGSTGLLIDG
jgi:hypothetical protein